MELSGYLEILIRRKWIIIICTAVTALVFYFGQSQLPTNYEATTVLRIVPYSSSNPSYTQLIYADRVINTYVKIASSTPILEELREILNLGIDRPKDIRVEVIPDTELLQITVEDQDPLLTSVAANTMAEIIMNENVIRDIRIYIVEPAVTPSNASSMRGVVYTILAVILGFAGGVGLTFLLENLDTRLHTPEQVHKFIGLAILGEIPLARSGHKSPDKILFSDAFRRLRSKIFITINESSKKTLLVTSAEPNEGKSTIAVNLGLCMALAGQEVVVVDADLHNPTVHSFFNLPNNAGMSNVLEGNITLDEVLIKDTVPKFYLLTSGPPVTHPVELLGSERMSGLLQELREKFQVVIIDSPAYLGVADTTVLAPAVDGVLLVVRVGSARQSPLDKTYNQLEGIQAKCLGVIVNRVSRNHRPGYYEYYYPSTDHRAKNKSYPSSNNSRGQSHALKGLNKLRSLVHTWRNKETRVLLDETYRHEE